MNCLKCGYSLPEGSIFCPYCGTKAEPLQPAPAEVPHDEPIPLTPPSAPVPDSDPIPEPDPEPDSITATPQDTETTTPSAPKEASKKKISAGKVIAIILFCVIFAASIGLNVFQFIRNSAAEKELSSQLKTMTKDAKDLQEEVEDLQSDMIQQTETIRELNESILEKDEIIRTQEGSITDLKSQLTDLQTRADAFDLICDELRYQNVGYAASNYYASTGVVIMDKWYSEQFTVKANWNSTFTVSLVETSGIVEASWGEDWHSDGETIDVIITPTGVTGVDIITFTNDQDNKTFKVLIIVTD